MSTLTKISTVLILQKVNGNIEEMSMSMNIYEKIIKQKNSKLNLN